MTLQEEAEHIIEKLSLLEELKKFGDAHLVGNVALNTTVKPDIDFLIYLEHKKWEKTITLLKEYFFNIGMNDFHERLLKESNKYLLSFDYIQSETRWTIDITLTDKKGDYLSDSYQFYLDFSDKFTKDKIKIIKRIKEYFWAKDMLRNSMSYYIYRAVIDNDAKNVQDVFNYLESNKVNISRFKRNK